MSTKENDIYYERAIENAKELLQEKYKELKSTVYDEKTYIRSNRRYTIKELKADIKRIKAEYKAILNH